MYLCMNEYKRRKKVQFQDVFSKHRPTLTFTYQRSTSGANSSSSKTNDPSIPSAGKDSKSNPLDPTNGEQKGNDENAPEDESDDGGGGSLITWIVMICLAIMVGMCCTVIVKLN